MSKHQHISFSIENLDLWLFEWHREHTVLSFTILVVVAALIATPFVYEIFSVAERSPLGDVYEESGYLFALHLFTDVAIGLAYVAITAMLSYFAYKAGRAVPFLWAFVAFGVFIVACGLTHIMSAFLLWKPVYWVAGGVKWLTAIVSVGTAVAIPPLIPKALELVNIAQVAKEREDQIKEQAHTMQELAADYKEKADALEQQKAELETKTEQLEQLNKFMVGRETKMIELKEEMEHLKEADKQ